MAKKGKKISIVFEKDKEIKPSPVSGAWGGSSPDGLNLVVEFFLEYQTTPNYIDVNINETGKMDNKSEERISRGDITRKITSVSVMAPETAIVVGKWLTEKGNELLKAKK